jgi:microcystin-dependent protein
LPPGGTPVNNDQPSLSVNYIIATQGIFPSQGGSSGGFSQTTATLGEIVPFAGNYAPAGWALANGQTLLDTSNEALFNIIGTMYGSNGPGTFDLPDLDGLTIIGADGSSINAGFEEGVDSNVLTGANIPTASAAPEPASAAILGFGLVGVLGARRRRGTI